MGRIRNQGNHLSDEDIDTLRAAFRRGVCATQAAPLVHCSERIAQKYFAFFRLDSESEEAFGPRSPYDNLNPWQPPPFHAPNVLPHVAHKIRWGSGRIRTYNNAWA